MLTKEGKKEIPILLFVEKSLLTLITNYNVKKISHMNVIRTFGLKEKIMSLIFNLISKKLKVKMEEKSGEKKNISQNLSYLKNEELKDYIYTRILKHFFIYLLIIKKILYI